MATIPEIWATTNAAIMPGAKGSTPTGTCRSSMAPVPAMTTIDIRKENSAAAAGVTPVHSAAAMVAPERETAGMIATAWATPIRIDRPSVIGAPRIRQKVHQQRTGFDGNRAG